MNSAMFTYRRRVKAEGSDEEVYNDNYINPFNVTSYFWEVNPNGVRVLNVFLTNNFSQVFGEGVGQRFCEHMENFGRFLLQARFATSTSQSTNAKPQRRTSQPIDVIEEPVNEVPQASWS